MKKLFLGSAILIFFILIMNVWLSGCGNNNSNPTAPVTVIVLVTATYTPTGSPTISPTITLTPTSSFTPVNSPTPTVTVQPTLCTGTFGYAYTTSTIVNDSGTNINAQGVSIGLSEAVTAYNLGIYIGTGSTPGQISGAIYDGTVSSITTLIVQSAPQSIVQGDWNEIPIPSTSLNPGFYWLAFLAQGSINFCKDLANSSNSNFITSSTVTFGNFPATMPSGNIATNVFNFYVDTCP